MGATSTIQWTDATWTPIRARVREDAGKIALAKGYTSLLQIASAMAGRVGPHCEHVSPGCENCYSEAGNGRCLPANGTGLPFDRRSRDLVEIQVDEKILEQPLHWRKPRKIFVCSQTDMFADFVTDEMIDRVFAVMALCPQHTFQVLTKRSIRMLNWMCAPGCLLRFDEVRKRASLMARGPQPEYGWPLPNVWLGVSVEDQQRADERIPHLLATPAALRFVSAEPLLRPVDLFSYFPCSHEKGGCATCRDWEVASGIDWVIVGGESGPGARPCDLAWVHSIVMQCENAGVACFVKQAGSHVIQSGERRKKADKKGGDMHEWPHNIRVRQMPQPAIRI